MSEEDGPVTPPPPVEMLQWLTKRYNNHLMEFRSPRVGAEPVIRLMHNGGKVTLMDIEGRTWTVSRYASVPALLFDVFSGGERQDAVPWSKYLHPDLVANWPEAIEEKIREYIWHAINEAEDKLVNALGMACLLGQDIPAAWPDFWPKNGDGTFVAIKD